MEVRVLYCIFVLISGINLDVFWEFCGSTDLNLWKVFIKIVLLGWFRSLVTLLRRQTQEENITQQNTTWKINISSLKAPCFEKKIVLQVEEDIIFLFKVCALTHSTLGQQRLLQYFACCTPQSYSDSWQGRGLYSQFKG